MIREKPHPFALSLSKGEVTNKGFDRACPEPAEGLSPNGGVYFGKITKRAHAQNWMP
jgi:hypothetical protein